MKAHGIVEASCQLWDSRPFNRGSTLQQGHLGRLASVDREREPQRRIERDSKHVVAEVPNLIRSLALRLRHETGALQEELERQRLPAGPLQRVVADDRVAIGRRERRDSRLGDGGSSANRGYAVRHAKEI